ncbi:hypothetical protein like AT5G13090 [Hibiscus trionum]|uniref:Uncharacterized protein n=1 Tax=Hibiscus trionum TaxID=183268 RepID=A0A9W7M0T7_HIBTR|nr:hypothetical protein like AT5G13090 [Hibiscus trionum]
MKLENKGKVYPSPSPPSPSPGEDYLSILKLLPAAIFALASALSVEDREVLAYLISRSLKTTTTTAIATANNRYLISQDCHSSKKPSFKKPPPPPASKLTQMSGVSSHKPSAFDCDCFDCYMSYWLRWDSSPNLDLIHQIIEAFEDYLTNGESQKLPKENSRPKRRKCNSRTTTPVEPDDEGLGSESPTVEAPVFSEVAEVEEVTEDFPVAKGGDMEVRTAASNHKGLARKLLPDILGLFNSRLCRLWNPNV